jgi:hypothetical protein
MTIKAAPEDGPTRLGLSMNASDDVAPVTCGKMSLKMPGDQLLSVRTKGKQVEVRGPNFHASADSVTFSGPHHTVIALDGHVRLSSKCGEDPPTCVTCEHLGLIVHEVHIEILTGFGTQGAPGTKLNTSL